MDENFKKLKEIESDLVLELEQNSTFKKLESVRNTLSFFSNGNSADASSNPPSLVVIPSAYDNDLTWAQRIIFIVNKLKNAFVSEIVSEMQKLGAKEDVESLTKRVGVIASDLKKKKKLGAKAVGKKSKYFIK